MYTQATPELILQAYREGIFPMAESAQSAYFSFYRPEHRGQLSIDSLHVPKRLQKTIRQMPYRVSVNENFSGVIDLCAETTKGRTGTWINKTIRDVFVELHAKGFAHSVECWTKADGGVEDLAGGVYGLAIGGVFCGESMATRSTDASKIALVHLCARLKKAGFEIFDTQFTNPHLEQFGVYEIPQQEYEEQIDAIMQKRCDFMLRSENSAGEETLVNEYLDFLNG